MLNVMQRAVLFFAVGISANPLSSMQRVLPACSVSCFVQKMVSNPSLAPLVESLQQVRASALYGVANHPVLCTAGVAVVIGLAAAWRVHASYKSSRMGSTLMRLILSRLSAPMPVPVDVGSDVSKFSGIFARIDKVRHEIILFMRSFLLAGKIVYKNFILYRPTKFSYGRQYLALGKVSHRILELRRSTQLERDWEVVNGLQEGETYQGSGANIITVSSQLLANSFDTMSEEFVIIDVNKVSRFCSYRNDRYVWIESGTGMVFPGNKDQPLFEQ